MAERRPPYNPNGTPPPADATAQERSGRPPGPPAEEAPGVLGTIEGQRWVDGLARPVQRPLDATLERAGPLRAALRGAFLGHPLHPALTDVPVGAWTVGVLFDLVDLWRSDPGLRYGADAAHAVGLAGSLGAAVTGLAEWSDTDGAARRVGFVHGLTNVVVAGLFGTSLLARARGARPLGVGLAAGGYLLLVFSAWLGGELAFRYGVGVDRPAEAHQPVAPAAPAPGQSPVRGAA